jgi:hypothetical protein
VIGDVSDPMATIRAFIQGSAQIYERGPRGRPTDLDAFAV